MEREEKHNRATLWRVIHILGIALAAAVTEVFLLLSLNFYRGSLKPVYYLLAVIGGSVLNGAVLVTDYISYFLKKQVVYKFCITLYVMAVFFAVTAYILIRTGFFDIMRDEELLEDFLRKSGWWMYIIFVLLQFLQVVLLPIPSTVTVVAGAALFGPLIGSLLSLLGIVIGSLVAFLIGRYAGIRVVSWLIGKETLEKWLKKIKGKDKLLLSAMFLLPVFPDDVLCFVAGMSSMSLVFFLAVIAVSRVLAIFTTSYSITLIPFNTWWGLMIWGILLVLVIILFVFLYKKSDAILGWFEKKFHRETRVKEKTERDEFTMEVVGPDGAIISKGVKREGEDASGKEVPPKE